MSTKSDGAFCYGDDLELREDLEGPTLDFCSRDLATSYLRVYVSALETYDPPYQSKCLTLILLAENLK